MTGRLRLPYRCAAEFQVSKGRWVSILVGILFFLQGFSLGGIIASFGLVLDLIGFALFLIFVLVGSVILLTRDNAPPAPRVESSGQLPLRGQLVQGPYPGRPST